MKEEGKEEINLRTSDASTVDYDYSSDEEYIKFKNYVLGFSPKDAHHLFEPLPDEVLLKYTDLELKLDCICSILQDEIAPTNIRDEKCLLATSVNLTSVCGSKLLRRRTGLGITGLSCRKEYRECEGR
ncbi:hypothetical protein SteCoe_1375 [Stentor coeruleus]|uniref:Uncharacterized protein n=1 Tax=Stentor coeruleus TaxID=5963 RepID=A0A1R2D231_9CILI|nr:hypothetical protein SteCoe_1375 [Stentor coeruleus]